MNLETTELVVSVNEEESMYVERLFYEISGLQSLLNQYISMKREGVWVPDNERLKTVLSEYIELYTEFQLVLSTLRSKYNISKRFVSTFDFERHGFVVEEFDEMRKNSMGVKQSIALEVEELNKVQLAYTDYVIMKDMYNDFKTDEYMSKLRDARVSYELAYRAILMKYAPNHQNWEISFETGELLLK